MLLDGWQAVLISPTLGEDTVWEEIEAMEDWWKETTWSRLIQRELPDL